MNWLEKIVRNNLGIDYLWHKQLRGEESPESVFPMFISLLNSLSSLTENSWAAHTPPQHVSPLLLCLFFVCGEFPLLFLS